VLSALPDVIERAQEWITHLGNVAAPLTGVIVADYIVVHRMRFDVPALFERGGRYAYIVGVNAAAVAATVAGVAVYYTVSDGMVKVVWGVATAAAAYVVLARAQQVLQSRRRPTSVPAPRLIDER
jgi:cytosine/uracil/thiamine/allantoin permease